MRWFRLGHGIANRQTAMQAYTQKNSKNRASYSKLTHHEMTIFAATATDNSPLKMGSATIMKVANEIKKSGVCR
jgi:hypothetical protein